MVALAYDELNPLHTHIHTHASRCHHPIHLRSTQLIWRGVPDSIRESVYLYLRRRNDMRKDKRLCIIEGLVSDQLLGGCWRVKSGVGHITVFLELLHH